jgi:aminoglycoside phosphotransferase (APT) family kinase protein
MKQFFTTEDPLENIIHDTLKTHKVKSTKHIISGWTNIVIEVSTDQGEYFFRFPRNPFWAKMIVKDASFCNFIEGKTSFYTPSMTLHFHKKRPFSVHEKIQGYSLNNRIYNLSHTTLAATAYSVAKFVKELSEVDIKDAPEDVKYPLSKFLQELDHRHYDTHLDDHHKYVKNAETIPRLVHGDLNPGNIIMNEKDEVIGVIDFCFAGISHPGMDISRIISRPTPETFESELLRAYRQLNNGHLPVARIRKMQKIWQDVDAGYANHIRQFYPEITLPEKL